MSLAIPTMVGLCLPRNPCYRRNGEAMLSRSLLVTVGLASWFANAGCQKEAEKAPPPPTPQDTIDLADNGRFQVVPTSDGVALDTRTGLACATTISNNRQLPLCLDLLMNGDEVVKQLTDARKAETRENQR